MLRSLLTQMRQIRQSVPTITLQMLIVTLVLSRLHFGNAVPISLPACLLHWVQSVQNAAAQLIYRLRHSDNITDALLNLH